MRKVRLVAVFSIALLMACGGDDDGGDGGDGGDDAADDGGDGGDGGDDGGDGPDPGTALSDLSESEAVALCESLDETFAEAILDLQYVTCYLGGLAMKDCEGFAEDCLEMDPVGEAPLDCGALETGDVPPCAADVTVGDVTDCFDAMLALWGSLADEITCDSAPEDFEDLDEIPAACQDLADLCPDL